MVTWDQTGPKSIIAIAVEVIVVDHGCLFERGIKYSGVVFAGYFRAAVSRAFLDKRERYAQISHEGHPRAAEVLWRDAVDPCPISYTVHVSADVAQIGDVPCGVGHHEVCFSVVVRCEGRSYLLLRLVHP